MGDAIKDLIKRCERVGWDTRRTGKGHTQIVTHQGRKFTLADGSGDWRAARNAEATALRYGLAEREQRQKEIHQRKKRKTLAAEPTPVTPPEPTSDPVPAAAPAAAAVTTAPAPEPPMPTTPPPPDGMWTETVQVDPDWARHHLAIDLPEVDGQPLLKRKLIGEHVDDLAGKIDRGEWQLLFDGIALAPNGSVLDGQHRLHAIIRAGATVPLRVTHHVDPHTYADIDTGKARAPQQVLSMAGEVNTLQLASALRLLRTWLLWWEDPQALPHWSNWHKCRVSNRQVLATLQQHPRMREAVRVAGFGPRIGSNAAAFAVCYHLTRWWWPDGEPLLDRFRHQLSTGEELTVGDPVHTLREWCQRRRHERHQHKREYHLVATLTAWRRYAAGQRMSRQAIPGTAAPMAVPYHPHS